MEENYSQQVINIRELSLSEAKRLNSSLVEPEHILLGILKQGFNKAINVIELLSVDVDSLYNEVEQSILGSQMIVDKGSPVISDLSERIFRISRLESKLLRCSTTNTEHLLLAILKEDNNMAKDILSKNEISYVEVYEMLRRSESQQEGNVSPVAGFTDEDDDDDHKNGGLGSSNNFSSTHSEATSKGVKDTPVLDNFGTDLTKAAENNHLDPIVGRDKEIERLAQILCRRKKNNPVLIGEPGVGKSAIVEGLAIRIAQKRVSRILFDKRVITLDMASVVAGTKYRGQFEERMKSILNELKRNPEIILFIDELHTIVGTGGGGGSLDAANILKPALARGEVQCIGATTLDEYRKNIEKDGA
ncbi:MAG: Clp protease N-terminal domain-containing protein, partial [Bacteroidales bacterium]